MWLHSFISVVAYHGASLHTSATSSLQITGHAHLQYKFRVFWDSSYKLFRKKTVSAEEQTTRTTVRQKRKKINTKKALGGALYEEDTPFPRLT